MVDVKVDASEFKGEEDKLIEKLADFLKEKTGGEVVTNSKMITVTGEGAALAKKYVRVTVKKFIHKHQMTEQFKVIADTEKEGNLYIKERKQEEED
jgi:hypothetical protein